MEKYNKEEMITRDTQEEKDAEVDLDEVEVEDVELDEKEDKEDDKKEEKSKGTTNPDLPGLNVKDGEFRVMGTISASPIFRRKGPNTNIAKSSGYALEEVSTGKVMYVTKREGVNLAYVGGMRNGYILQNTKKTMDSNNEVIKTTETMYLQPYPARAESFTQDGRLISVFELDENNKIEYPLNLQIDEELCTTDFWLHIQEIYEKKKLRRRRTEKREQGKAKKRENRLKDIAAEISKDVINNPFEE